MTVRVLLFASLRDRAGTNALDLTLPDGASVQSAVDLLTKQCPGISGSITRVMFAVNQQYCDAQTTLTQGDELALIPPVSGG